MKNNLFDHQKEALKNLKTGSVLSGGVGSGKSLTGLAYYFENECGGKLETEEEDFKNMTTPKDLYIITTARKRDTLEWDKECANFMLRKKDRKNSLSNVLLVIDSWNNIKKYIDVENAFFIFDEQRVIGSGSWVKSFLKITKKNSWILLTATPGDTWLDYIPVFIANGYYKNRTEFMRRHVIYSRFSKFPRVDKYIEMKHLEKLKQNILVPMSYDKKTRSQFFIVNCEYNKNLYSLAMRDRWDPYNNVPIRDAGRLCYILRKIVNSDNSRLEELDKIIEKHKKVIIFYNFNYELEILRRLKERYNSFDVKEYNGHKHEPLPNGKTWAYLVQYTSGAEGWNCVETNTIVFYSQNYSYKIMVQAAGRIDRINTKYIDLYYYHLRSYSNIDLAISRALKEKRNFNEKQFVKK